MPLYYPSYLPFSLRKKERYSPLQSISYQRKGGHRPPVFPFRPQRDVHVAIHALQAQFTVKPIHDRNTVNALRPGATPPFVILKGTHPLVILERSRRRSDRISPYPQRRLHTRARLVASPQAACALCSRVTKRAIIDRPLFLIIVNARN